MSEKVKIKIARNVVHLPAIALRGLVVFPNNVVHFEVGRTKSIAAIEAAIHVPVCWSSTSAKSICRPRYAPWRCAASLPTSATRSRLSSAA